jgi:hypothetical protein
MQFDFIIDCSLFMCENNFLPRPANAKTIFSFKINHHSYYNKEHDDDNRVISILIFQFRHMLKIHPINTSYKSQRNKIADTMVSVFMISFIL